MLQTTSLNESVTGVKMRVALRGRAYALLVRRKACNKSNQLSQFALK